MDVRIGVLSHIVLKHSHTLKKEKIESTLNRGAGARGTGQNIIMEGIFLKAEKIRSEHGGFGR